MVLSQLPDASKWLSQIDFNEVTLFECPSKGQTNLLSYLILLHNVTFRSQIFIILFSLPLASSKSFA